MKTLPCRLKIKEVGQIQTELTASKTTRKVTLVVVDVPVDNPFGHNNESQNPFEVLVYNHNIDNWDINTTLIGEIADCELDIRFYKKSGQTTTQTLFIVNDLKFRL